MSRFPASLGPQAKRLVSASSESDQRVSVMLRCRADLTPEQRDELAAMGIDLRSAAGDVVTAFAAVRALVELAERDYIEYVEVSRPLYPEQPQGE